MSGLNFVDNSVYDKVANKTKKWKVLIADDEPSIHDVTILALDGLVFENREIEFISAYSGKETIEQLQKHPDTAVVLLDVVMEENKSGLIAAKEIRKILNNKNVRIILRTGQPGEAIERDVIFEYDINDYKEKVDLSAYKLYTCVVTAIRSYSDIIKIEEKNKELERTNKQLEQAKRDLEKESRVKSLFLTNITHEIRTPMNGIVGMVSLLGYTNLDEMQKKYLESIDISTNILLKMITDIIDISQMETGKIELSQELFDFREFFHKTIEPFAFSARAKGLDLTHYIGLDIPKIVKGDKDRLKQIIINIMSNAVKYTNKGNIHLNVTSSYVEGTKIQFKFDVSDTGVGIAEEKFDEIFEPFIQEDLTNTKVFQGIGLGLSVSKRLIELMGGDIQVISTKGKGSNFTFTVNLKKAD